MQSILINKYMKQKFLYLISCQKPEQMHLTVSYAKDSCRPPEMYRTEYFKPSFVSVMFYDVCRL